MARYEGRHRAAPAPTRRQQRNPSRHGAPRQTHTGRKLAAGGLVAGLGVGGWAYASEDTLGGSQDAAYVTSQSQAAAAMGGAATTQAALRGVSGASRSQERAALPAATIDTAALASASKTATTAATQRMVTAKKAADALAAKEAAAKAKAKKEADAAADKKAAIANAKQDPKSAARVLMNEYSWASDRQFGCLVQLWTGESDWRWWAKNPSSGAYGIPQSLPASKMAKFGSDYRTNPITQLKWGLWYIDVSYGTPCRALSFWQSNMPHWY